MPSYPCYFYTKFLLIFFIAYICAVFYNLTKKTSPYAPLFNYFSGINYSLFISDINIFIYSCSLKDNSSLYSCFNSSDILSKKLKIFALRYYLSFFNFIIPSR